MLVTLDEYNYIFNHPTNKSEKRQKELLQIGFTADATKRNIYPIKTAVQENLRIIEVEKIENGLKDLDIWTVPSEFKKIRNIFHREIRKAKKSSGVGYAGDFDSMTKEKIKDETIRKYLKE